MNWDGHARPVPAQKQVDLSWMMPVATQMGKPGQAGQDTSSRQARTSDPHAHTTTGPASSGSYLPPPPPLFRYPGAVDAAQPLSPHSLVSSQGAYPPNRVSTSVNLPTTSQPSFPAQQSHPQQPPQMAPTNHHISATRHTMGPTNNTIGQTNHTIGQTNHTIGQTNHTTGQINHMMGTPRTAHQQLPQPAPQFDFMPSIPNISDQLDHPGSVRHTGHQGGSRTTQNAYPGSGMGGPSQTPQMPRQSSPHQQQFSPPPVQQQQQYKPTRQQTPPTHHQQHERSRQPQYQPSSSPLQTGSMFPPGHTPVTYSQPGMRGPVPCTAAAGSQPRYGRPAGDVLRLAFPQLSGALPRQRFAHQPQPQPRQPCSQPAQAPTRMPAPAHQPQQGPLPPPPPYRPRGPNPSTVPRQPGNMYTEQDHTHNPAAQTGTQSRFPHLQGQLQQTSRPRMPSSVGDYRPSTGLRDALTNLSDLNLNPMTIKQLLVLDQLRKATQAGLAGLSANRPVMTTPSSEDKEARIRTAFVLPQEVPDEPSDKAILGRWYTQPDEDQPLPTTATAAAPVTSQPGPAPPTLPTSHPTVDTSQPGSTLQPPYNVPTPAGELRPPGVPSGGLRLPTSVQVAPGLPGAAVSKQHPSGGAQFPPGIVQTGPPGNSRLPGELSAPPAGHQSTIQGAVTPHGALGESGHQSTTQVHPSGASKPVDDDFIVPSLQTEHVVEYKVVDLLRYLKKFTSEYNEKTRKSQEGERPPSGRRSLELVTPVQDQRTSLDTQMPPGGKLISCGLIDIAPFKPEKAGSEKNIARGVKAPAEAPGALVVPEPTPQEPTEEPDLADGLTATTRRVTEQLEQFGRLLSLDYPSMPTPVGEEKTKLALEAEQARVRLEAKQAEDAKQVKKQLEAEQAKKDFEAEQARLQMEAKQQLVAQQVKARLEANRQLEAEQAEQLEAKQLLEAQQVKARLEAEQARKQLVEKQAESWVEVEQANIQRDIKLQLAEKVRMQMEAEKAKQPVTPQLIEEKQTTEMAEPIIECDIAEDGYIVGGGKTTETAAVSDQDGPSSEPGSLLHGGVGKKRKREGSDADSDSTVGRGNKRPRGARGSSRARGRGKHCTSVMGQGTSVTGQGTSVTGQGTSVTGQGTSARGQTGRGGAQRARARGQHTHAARGKAKAGPLLAGAVSQAPDTQAQAGQPAQGPRGARGYRGHGRGRGRGRSRARGRGAPPTPTSSDTPSSQPTMDRFLDTLQLTPTKTAPSDLTQDDRTTATSTDHTQDLPEHVHPNYTPTEPMSGTSKHKLTSPGVTRKKKARTKGVTVSEEGEELSSERDKMETDEDSTTIPPQLGMQAVTDNCLDIRTENTTVTPDQHSQMPVHEPEQSGKSDRKIDTTVCGSAPKDKIAEDMSTTSEGGDTASTLTIVPVETIKISDSYKMTWIRFHGKVTTRLITDEGNFFLVKEIFRRCFRIQAAEKRAQMMKIHTIMRTVLKIKETQLPQVMLPFVIKNLKKRKVIKTVPETFMMILEEDAMALFHYIYKDRYCVDACSAVFYKDTRRAVDDTSTAETGQTLSASSSLPATPERQIHDPLRRDDVKSPLTPNRNIFDVIVGEGSADKRRLKLSGSAEKRRKRGRELINLCSDSEGDGYESDKTLPYMDGEPLRYIITEDVDETEGKTGSTREVLTEESVSGDKSNEATSVGSSDLPPDTSPVMEKDNKFVEMRTEKKTVTSNEFVNNKTEDTVTKPEEIIDKEDKRAAKGNDDAFEETVEMENEETVGKELEEIAEKELTKTVEVDDEHADYKVCHEAVKVSLVIVLDSDEETEKTKVTALDGRRPSDDGSGINDGEVTIVDDSANDENSHSIGFIDVGNVGSVTNVDGVISDEITNVDDTSDDVTIVDDVEEQSSAGNSKYVQHNGPSNILESNSCGDNSKKERTCDVLELSTASSVTNHTNMQSHENSISKEVTNTDRDLMSPVESIKKLTDSLIVKQDLVQTIAKPTEKFKIQDGSNNLEAKNCETKLPETKHGETFSEKSSDGEMDVEMKGRFVIPELPFSCELADLDISAYERKVRECIEKANRTDDMDELADVCFEVLEITKPLEELPRKYLAQIDKFAISNNSLTQDERHQLMADLPLGSQQIVIDLEDSQDDTCPQLLHGNPSDLDNGT